jgi:CheY-like chemotaxis protein
MMPGMNGFEVLQTIRAQPWLLRAKIIVFSNLNDPKDRQKCVDLWADEFILKASITPKELIERIQKLLG